MRKKIERAVKKIPWLHWLSRLMARSVMIRRVPNPNARQLMITLSWPRIGSAKKKLQALPPLVDSEDVGIKLNIGGGKGHPKLQGWMVVDLREGTADVVLDITENPLPYDDDSVDIIFTSHMLEHIYPQKLEFVLKEFHRVLKPDRGLLRISVPDIQLAIDAYSKSDFSFFENSHVAVFNKDAPIGGLLASWFYSTRIFTSGGLKHGEGHVHCFDYDYLASWLTRCGFGNVWRSNYLQSRNLELRDNAFDVRPQDSLFVEATK